MPALYLRAGKRVVPRSLSLRPFSGMKAFIYGIAKQSISCMHEKPKSERGSMPPRLLHLGSETCPKASILKRVGFDASEVCIIKGRSCFI